MNSNNNSSLLEFGGTGDLIATAICDFDTPTKSFKTGDVVLNLVGTNIQIFTSSSTKRANTNKLVLEHTNVTVSGLQCTHIPIDNQIYNIFGYSEEEFTVTESENIYCFVEGSLMLNEYIEDTESIRISNIDDYLVTNDNAMRITTITSKDFKQGNSYLVWYSKKISKPFIKLDSYEADIPYLKIQISITGNLDKNTSKSYLFVEKTRLHFMPYVNLNDSSMTHCNLLFSVIDDDIKPKLVM